MVRVGTRGERSNPGGLAVCILEPTVAVGALTRSRPTARGLRALGRERVSDVVSGSDGLANECGQALTALRASADHGCPGSEAVFPRDAFSS